jgi:hypothetical protein
MLPATLSFIFDLAGAGRPFLRQSAAEIDNLL